MTFENFSRLTGASLLNSPAISSFGQIELNPKKIKRGDLFIGDKKEDIELALHNEAYGILTESDFQILDDEIAWLKSEQLDEVLIRLLRFTLLEKKFRFVNLLHVELELIKKIADKEHLTFLDSDEKESYKKIINADEDTIFFSCDKLFLQKIYPEYETFYQPEKPLFHKIQSSLFLSSFTYKDKAYKNIKISPLFLNHLEKVVYFLNQNRISKDIEKCSFTSHFHPIFVNQKLNRKPFGKSDHVIICESDKTLIEQELSYLTQKAPWAKVLYFELSHLNDLDKLKNIEYNFAIIIIEYDKLIQKLEKNEKKEQLLLF